MGHLLPSRCMPCLHTTRALPRKAMIAATLAFAGLVACSGGSSSGSSSGSGGGSGPSPNPVPAVTSISPASANAGSGALTLTVNGSGFLSGSSVQWNGNARTTTYVSSTQVTASIGAGDLATGGNFNVTVTNPSPGGGTSSAVTFAVDNPVPAVTSLSPASASVGGDSFTLTVTGSNFVNGSTIQWGGNALTTSYQSATQLTATVPAADLASAGNVAVTVVNGAPGGGASAGTNFIVVPPPPTVSISFSPGSIAPRGTSTVTWSSSNSSDCTASGAWSGSEASSGTQSVTQSAVGNYKYSLSCTGAGGTGSASASLLVTEVKPSSYENKNALGVAPVSLNSLSGINAFAVADFMNDGGQTLVYHTLEYNPSDPSTYSNYGHIHFFEKGTTGGWVEKTSQLLSNTTGCIHARKAVVADFNRDGKPDVYFACHGVDAPPFPGEQPHLLLSQPDGTYTNVTIPVTCYCHGASAVDVNGDGYPDVLVTDTSVAQTPFFFINNGDGTFTQDLTRLPPSLKGKQIYSAELIDFNGSGHYDVFLGGNEPGTTNYASSEFSPVILPNDGKGSFISTTPVDLLVGSSYGLALDILYENGYVYLLKVNAAYTSNEIQKISYPALQGNVIYTNSTAYPNGSQWLNWILPYNGDIVSQDASYGVSVTQ